MNNRELSAFLIAVLAAQGVRKVNESERIKQQRDLILSEIARRKSDNAWRRTQNAMVGTAILLIMAGSIGLAVAIMHGWGML